MNFDIDVFVGDLIRSVELKSLGDLEWREKFKERIVLYAHDNYDAGRQRGYEMGYVDGWSEAWAIAE
jgi:hypothetical protein